MRFLEKKINFTQRLDLEKGAAAVEYTCILAMLCMVLITSLTQVDEDNLGIGPGAREALTGVGKAIEGATRPLFNPLIGGGGGPGNPTTPQQPSGGSEGTFTGSGSQP